MLFALRVASTIAAWLVVLLPIEVRVARGQAPSPQALDASAVDGIFLQQPALMDVGERHVAIVFELREPAAVTVELGNDHGKQEIRAEPAAFHEIVVEGLEPGTRYRYHVRVGPRDAAGGELTTAPPEGSSPIRFIVYGDSRSGPAAHRAVIASTGDADPMFVMHMGDMVAAGVEEQEWRDFFRIGAPLFSRAPLFPVLGNHELLPIGRGYAQYERRLRSAGDSAERYYSFQYGNVFFVVLDSNVPWDLGDAQWSWAVSELRAARSSSTVKHVFAAIHHGPLSSGRHGEHDGLVASGGRQMLADEGVSLIFSGHDHVYERGESDGLKYIVTGGGGSPLYEVNYRQPYQLAFEAAFHHVRVEIVGDRVSTVALRSDGTTIESCFFLPRGSWDCGGGVSQGKRGGTEPVWYFVTAYGPIAVLLVILLLSVRWLLKRRSPRS